MNTVNKKSSPVMGSTDWWKNQKKNSFHNILKLALYILIFFLIWGAIAPLVNNIFLFKWWKNQVRGLDNKYAKKNCLSFISIAYFLHFKVYWWINKYTSNEESVVQSEGEALMIMSLINNYGDGIVPGGALTGKALCQSIIPDWPPPTALLEIYDKCSSSKSVTIDNYDVTKSPTLDILYPLWNGFKDKKWPLASNSLAWKSIMYLWGAGGLCGENPNSSCSGQNKENSQKPPSELCKKNAPLSSCGFPAVWTTTRSDSKWLGNFLWGGYQIPYNSPVVVGYMTGSGNLCNTSVKTGSLPMQKLLGTNIGEGNTQGVTQRNGWWGAIRSISSNYENTTQLQIYNYFWQNISEETSGSGNAPPDKSGADTRCSASGITTAVTSGLGAAAGIAMCCGPPCWLIGAAAGVATGMAAAGKGGCCHAIGSPPCCNKGSTCPAAPASGGDCSIM